MTRSDFKIKIFADGADAKGMKEMYAAGYVSGFTTNPTLMKKAGVSDYASFARSIAAEITDLPLSFEVFADDFDTMEQEARKISSWGKNVYVKIPVTNSQGESSCELIRKLSSEGMKLNITALLTLEQVKNVVAALTPNVGAYVSVFAGRIADTGVDPKPVMKQASALCHKKSGIESLWASTREVLNIFQAQDCGVDIITVTNDILKKLPMLGKDLTQLSLETVQMFRGDALSLGYKIV
ncbi:MAG: transaldolase [Termitinemataceae bacterium]|jgi:transaldolase|nr:MAG: transaldolase [Termitinemataceae bacterium]